MAIIDVPVTTQGANDHPNDTLDGHAPLATLKTPSPEPFQQGDQGDGESEVPEETNSGSLGATGKKPSIWTWGFRELNSLLTEAKGAATNEVVKFVRRHLVGTKLIFVVGKAGTGKTSILSELTFLDELKVGTTLKTGTKSYRVCPGIVDDEQYLFIDTAGFGDPDREDIETFKDSVSSLIAFGSFIEVVGVLYVIGNLGTRVDQQDVKTLRWLQCFCGPDFFRNITIITSFWDSHKPKAFKQAFDRVQGLSDESNFDRILNPSVPEKRYHGANIYHHGVTGGNLTLDSYPGLDYEDNKEERREELRNLIRRRYAERRYKPVKLQFMQQLENKIPFLETEAAKVIRAPVVGTTVNIVKGRCVVEAVATEHETPPLNFSQRFDIPHSDWKKSLLEWWAIAVEAAKIFSNARKDRAQGANSRQAGIFERLFNWWNGSSTAGQS
ncbi:hypothetical protein FBEOM_4390 [Fusarium beomiforme]|uniref:G domain-containing protein n=1 Tax=Fusarium beomiforme TaxID=44412 RepID=A0A9P5DY49_9HYPO|nr:hypothetical protein FBEOM_4390 [Fusarium beomiforme]